MGDLTRHQIRMIILFGFVVAAIAEIILFINSVGAIGFPFTFRGVLDELIGPLATIASLCAWTALTRLEARDGAQLNTLRLVYLFFAIEYFIVSVGYNYLYTQRNDFGGFWTGFTLWLEFLGRLITTVGLFLMWRELNQGERSDETVVS
jgi:hypothetical protein